MTKAFADKHEFELEPYNITATLADKSKVKFKYRLKQQTMVVKDKVLENFQPIIV